MPLFSEKKFKELLLKLSPRVVDNFNGEVEPTAIYKRIFNVKNTEVIQTRGWAGGQYPALGSDGTPPPEVDEYRLAARLPRSFVEESSLPEVRREIAKLERRMLQGCWQAMELVGALVFLKAFDPNSPGPDGKPLCATDHLLYLTKDTYPNMPANPTTLSLAALYDAFVNMRLTPADNGLTLNLSPSILLVPPQLEVLAEVLTTRAEMPFSAQNTPNIIARRNLQVVVWNHLWWIPGAWFLLTAPNQHGLVYYIKTPPTVDVSGGAGYDALRRVYFFSVIMAVGAGFIDWRGVYGSNP